MTYFLQITHNVDRFSKELPRSHALETNKLLQIDF